MLVFETDLSEGFLDQLTFSFLCNYYCCQEDYASKVLLRPCSDWREPSLSFEWGQPGGAEGGGPQIPAWERLDTTYI